MTTFTAQIAAFRKTARNRIEAVHKASTQEIARIASIPRAQGGKMPVVEGNLRNSITGGATGGVTGSTPSGVALAIAGAEPFVELSFGWTAPYAAAVEFGIPGTRRQPAGFARGAAEMWTAVVADNARRAEALGI